MVGISRSYTDFRSVKRRAAAPEAKYIDVLPCFPSASIVSMRIPVRAGEGLCTAIGQRHGRDDCSDSEARLWF